MKSTAIALGTAALVVVLYLAATGSPLGGGLLPSLGEPRMRLTVEPPRAEAALAELPGVWPREGPTSVSTVMPGPDAEHRPVWTPVRRLLEVAKHKRDVALIDRGAMTRAFWEIRQVLTDADIPYLIEKWNAEPDPSFRWALSWLFESLHDDRFIAPLAELIAQHPRRAVDAIANLGTPGAARHLAEIRASLDDPELRAHACTRIGQSLWTGADECLASVWRDPLASDAERFAAVQALSQRSGSDEALRMALDVALGPPRPLACLAEPPTGHPVADLRSAAVYAAFAQADFDAARRLLAAADQPEADPAFVDLVEHHLVAYRGPDISRLVLARIERRGRISAGEARFLVNAAFSTDVPVMEAIARRTADPEVRGLVEAAIKAAETR